eukprot:evm.model.scf_1565.9 EVM.evm.TU.scf_1565.9   scf_1565:33973-36337(-)
MSFDLTHVTDMSSSFTMSDDMAGSFHMGETPTSNLSPFESSAFGSGSSVLSAFEPPTDDPLAIGQAAALAHLLEDQSAADASLEELEAVISKLQAIYLYRQGLKALTEERVQGVGEPQGAGAGGPSLAPDLQAAVLAGVRAPGNRSDSFSSAVPGSPNSIWRMNAATDIPAMQYPSGGGVLPAGGDFASSLAQLQYQLHQDMVRRYKRSRSGGRQNRFPRRRTHRRQASSPAALRPPQWADPSWHPMTAVLAKGEQAGAGTGVFIPAQGPGGEAKQQEMDDAGPESAGAKKATANDLPEEWLY